MQKDSRRRSVADERKGAAAGAIRLTSPCESADSSLKKAAACLLPQLCDWIGSSLYNQIPA